ncbi:hypothetical protein DES53_103393 [Roseimicrobium gellanilyticum]|uniref:BON domain-containing protein n=1 Tax=Roseimicrobium gellanilyticum TaxID=748857 RepID=A0A366HQL8_9BACT|nr:hypothetical protein [Roseimicrobium gellanilyticum]RBP45394.1 hypothetical protein DES53_103393 [Roseimicrobium gellanilyticum]
MRFLYTIILLLALPVLALLFRQEFLDRLQPKLATQVAAALSRPAFSGVKAELNYVDVSLRGTVDQPSQREEARAAVDAVPGLRCREEDNHLQIRPGITGTLAGSRLTLTGWLHRTAELAEISSWIQELRPGLEVEDSGVQVLPHVIPQSISSAQELPALLTQLQGVLRAKASLKVTRGNDTFRISGDLPTMKLRQAIVLAVPLGGGTTPLDFSELRAGPYVTAAAFADEEALPPLLSVFLTSPGAQSIEARGQELLIRGYATPSMRDRWMTSLNRFPERITIIAGFQVFPSLYHFPSYKPQSRLAADKVKGVQKSLSKAVIQFENGAVTAAPTQAAMLDDAAATIRDAGAEVRVIAGAAPLANETADAARSRAESIVSELVSRGVPAACLEAGVFEPVSSAEEPVARVELLVK